MKAIHLGFLAAAMGWLFGCVASQQIDLIEREQRRMRADTNAMQSDLDSMRGTLADTRANMQQMQRDVSALKERVDETRVQVGRQIGQTNREGDQRVKNLEDRLTKLEQEATNQAELIKTREAELQQLRDSMQQAAQRPEPVQNSVDLSLAESENIRKEFDTAWRSFEKKDYRGAIGRFKDFLKRNPKSKLAPSAQYAIGESYFALKEFDRAILEFDEV